MAPSRRDFLALAAASPLALLAQTGLRAADASACYDPATLPFSQKSRRRSLGYVDLSSDAKKHCSTCSFFTAATPASCGTCQMLGGGPVRADALCNFFAARAHA